MAGLGFGLSSAAGAGADALQELLKQKFLEQITRQKLAEDQRQADMMAATQRRGQDITTRGQDQLQGRFDMTRSDAQSAAAAAAAKEAEQQAAFDQFAGGLPEHMRPVAIGKAKFGLTMSPQDLVEAPLNRDAAQAFKIKGLADETRTREGIQHWFRMKELGAQHQNALALANQKGQGAGAQGSPYAAERGTRIQESVNDLIGRVKPTTAGFGSWLAAIPATDARNFAADLDKLKANIAFSELTEMREASKTGGALGQVSNIELQLLQSALGALDAGQSPENLTKNLREIAASSARWQEAKARHGGGGQQAGPQGTSGGVEFDYVPGKGLVPRGGG